ncbi:MAG: RidA family protein [Geminicoccaceae bacterium]|jgi:enamine deaminase RidA (YjgF/YER057c/UK114 family)
MTAKMHERQPSAEARLAAMGLSLPAVPAPVGNFDLGSIDGTTLYLSGQGPLLESGELARGKVGHDVSVDEANHHAMRTGLVLISAMKTILGSLDHVAQIHKVFGMVNGTPDFSEHPKVIDGCSDLFVNVFGVRGRHARAAVGMGSLPANITVEIDAVVSISPDWAPPRGGEPTDE